MLCAPLQPAAPAPRSFPPPWSLVVCPPDLPGIFPASTESWEAAPGHQGSKNVIYTKRALTASCTPGGRAESPDWHLPTAQPIALPGTAAPRPCRGQPGLVGGSWPWRDRSPELCSGDGSIGQELAVARCHGGAVGFNICRRSHLASLPAAWLLLAQNIRLGCGSAARWQRSSWGQAEASAGATCREDRAMGSLVALLGDPQQPWPPDLPSQPLSPRWQQGPRSRVWAGTWPGGQERVG